MNANKPSRRAYKNGVVECEVHTVMAFLFTCWKALVHFPRSWHRELDASTIDRWVDFRDCTLTRFWMNAGARTHNTQNTNTVASPSSEVTHFFGWKKMANYCVYSLWLQRASGILSESLHQQQQQQEESSLLLRSPWYPSLSVFCVLCVESLRDRLNRT